jgi:superfamily I DNA/RNA helicase
MVNKIKEYLHIFCPDKKIRQKITVIHYHQFVYNYCNKHGLVVEKKTYGEVVPSPIDEDECVTCPPVDADFNVWIPEFPEKYSAIIVDECQDFEKEWIDSLHKGLKDSGIMLFAADERQTIYNRSNTEENSDKIYTGVGGNWPKAFNQQYPYSNKILKMTTAFKNEFIENAEEPEKLKENDDESYLHYISGNGISSSDVCESIINYIKIMDIHINDIAIIAPENEYIRNLEYEFRTKYKQKVITVCETQEQYNRLCAKYPIINNDRKEFDNHLKKLRKTYRVNFRNENGKLKISTIHSFKGWISKFIVLILDEKFDNAPKSSYNYDKMLYTALTRAEKSILIINNRNTKYHKFFLTHCCDRLPEHLTNICIEQPKPEIIF